MHEMNILSTPKSKSKEEKYELLKQKIHPGYPDPVCGKSWLGAGNKTWQANLGAVPCRDNKRKMSEQGPGFPSRVPQRTESRKEKAFQLQPNNTGRIRWLK
jgi:hypothetical protein